MVNALSRYAGALRSPAALHRFRRRWEARIAVHWRKIFWALVLILVLPLAYWLGSRPSPFWVLLPALIAGAFILLKRIEVGPSVLILAALFGNEQIATGTEVPLNPATLLALALLVLWLLRALARHQHLLPRSAVVRPALLFLAVVLASWLTGSVLWNPAVPQPPNLLFVQAGQVAIYTICVGVFMWFGTVVKNQAALEDLVFLFLVAALPVALIRPFDNLWWNTGYNVYTNAWATAPFWVCVNSLALGQLLFNPRLTPRRRAMLVLIVVGIVVYSLVVHEEKVAHWAGIISSSFVLVFLRLRQGRWLLLFAAVLGVLLLGDPLYRFLGGDDKWDQSGASRIVLSGRVIEVTTAENPLLGLGPASYRYYAGMKPLNYGNAYWLQPAINAHNNYVDLYGNVGLAGLACILWLLAEIGRLGLRLRRVYPAGFAGAYVNSMLAALAGCLTIMIFLDWLLPYVYDAGFPGLQGAVLVWLFFGGLIALEAMARPHPSSSSAS